MTNETLTERLGRLVRARRKSLKLTQADVQELDGPSTATLRLIEGGKHADFRDGTGSALEAALQWQRGSIDTILAGGDPLPIELPTPEPPPDVPASRQPEWSQFRSRSFEEIFNEWQVARAKLLNLELEYAIGRRIDPDIAAEELGDVLDMLDDNRRGSGRPWTPPWDPGDQFEFGDEPWKTDWWITFGPSPDTPGITRISLSSSWDVERVRREHLLDGERQAERDEHRRREMAQYEEAQFQERLREWKKQNDDDLEVATQSAASTKASEAQEASPDEPDGRTGLGRVEPHVTGDAMGIEDADHA